ncbi:MAG: hypothetical protein H7Z37_04910 [Pyrinomonadaceae bacterium]|nr:hypothetical protein [Pyrinomonadaceae bacterium]
MSLTNGNSRGTLFGMRGGAICNFGTLTVMSSNISNNTAIENGGGIYNENGTVIVRDTTFDNNSVTGNTGIGGGGGGGFYTNFGTFELTGSTVSNNTVMNFGGGIFLINGTVMINNSTISGNSANGIEGASGGIENMNATLNVSNSTITNNRAINDSINNGGGIWSNSSTTIRNTIVAGNSVVNTESAPDIRVVRGMFVSNGNNLIGNTTNMGAAIAFQSTDIINQNARLTPLGNFGGTTKTHSLFANSPAIDKGDAAINTDQRGMMRPIDNPNVTNASDGSDIGAFEASLNPTAARVVVSGKIMSSNGRGIAKTVVSMTDEDGNVRRATTSAFGIYSFADVSISGIKIFTVINKRFSFVETLIVRSIIENTDDVNFTTTHR